VISLSEPILGSDEKNALLDVVESGWITMGERVRSFEHAFAKAQGAVDSIAVSSCTAGLHLILDALGIGEGDEVLVPSLSFVATANAVLYTRATPIFVDISSVESPLICLEDAAAKCTARTRAVIIVHYAGYLADRELWRDFASKRGLLLIEDAAHAAGAPGAGTFGVAAAFSFYGNKNMTTAEGGAVIASTEELSELIRRMRGHGLTSGTFQRHLGSTPNYDMTLLGYNYRMDEFRAAIGLVQLSKLQQWNQKRRMLTETYRKLLKKLSPEITVPFANHTGVSAHHIMPIVLPKGIHRPNIIQNLREAGVQTSIHYPPIHQFSFYRDRFSSLRLPKTEDMAARCLTLPLHPNLTETQIEEITAVLEESVTSEYCSAG
jgi:dTDP-4-amino-4,6-dideoxygalactose transaminase